MPNILLDTDVFSFLFKRDSRASLYAPYLAGAQPCLSFQTVAELRLWAIFRGWGSARSAELDASLRRCVILPSDNAIAHR